MHRQLVNMLRSSPIPPAREQMLDTSTCYINIDLTLPREHNARHTAKKKVGATHKACAQVWPQLWLDSGGKRLCYAGLENVSRWIKLIRGAFLNKRRSVSSPFFAKPACKESNMKNLRPIIGRYLSVEKVQFYQIEKSHGSFNRQALSQKPRTIAGCDIKMHLTTHLCPQHVNQYHSETSNRNAETYLQTLKTMCS